MSEPLVGGLYEILVTARLEAELAALEGRLSAKREGLPMAEAADRFALHLARVIERAIESVGDNERVERGAEIARALLARIDDLVPMVEAASDAPTSTAELLRAVLERRPDGSLAEIESPLIPLLDTTLLTNAPGTPAPRDLRRRETEARCSRRSIPVYSADAEGEAHGGPRLERGDAGLPAGRGAGLGRGYGG
jgi:hypothetical protein